MRLLGKRSLSSLLKILLDIAFWAAIGGGSLLVVGLALVGLSGTENTSLDLPVFFEIDPSSYQIESPAGPQVQTEIEEASGSLKITGGGSGLFLLPVLMVVPLFGAAALVLYKLRKIFRRLIQGRPFLPENAKNLRFIGVAVIVGELVWASFVYWSTRIVVNDFTASGVTLHTDFPVRVPVILAGLTLLIVAEVFREGAQMKADLEAAREIQFSLVSDTEYRIGPISIHSEMRPADSVGGDYYDVIDLGDGRIAFVLADVAGHGLPAALLMALLQGSLRSLISSGLRGAELVAKLNTYLVANMPENRMITFFYGELDPGSGQLTYVNAGHNPPYLYDQRGLAETRSDRRGSRCRRRRAVQGSERRAADGARVLLFTDGITEAANPADEEFGEERLEQLIGEQGQTAPDSLIESAVANVTEFCGKAAQADDMTMMVVSRGGTE